MAVMNNSVRLRVQFKSFKQVPADPLNITLRVYTENRRMIEEIALNDEEHRVGVGEYFIDYVVPRGQGDLIVEFSGVIEDSPVVERALLRREWVRE